MKLSNVLFLRALLFFAFATVSLVAGIPVPGNTVTKIQKPEDSAPTKYIPIINDIEYLGEGPSWGWRRLRAPGPVSIFLLFFFVFDLYSCGSTERCQYIFFFYGLCSCGFDKLDRTHL